MKIEAIDLFYLSIPNVRMVGDGSQDTLLVRVRAGGHEGWGECEASPLTSIASFVCPMSHSACRPVCDSVLGQRINGPRDIARISTLVRANSFDVLQADHTLSGIDIALWDLLGRKAGRPVYELLGYRRPYSKLAYASALFGRSPQATYDKVHRAVKRGYKAVKLGWGTFGRLGLKHDRSQLEAAREAAGRDVQLMVDAGTVWREDEKAAHARLSLLKKAGVVWLEEPFGTAQYGAYARLARAKPGVPLAGGEGSHNVEMATNMMDHAGIRFVQIDTGRVGGISAAKSVVDHARRCGVQFVNHTFTSNLALSASLQPYAGVKEFDLCEYPVELSELARSLTTSTLAPDADGRLEMPAGPGLGVNVNLSAVERYLQKVDISVNGRALYRTPEPPTKP